MKIAIISTIENSEWAGTEEVWAQFAQASLQQGHQVFVTAHWRVARSPQVTQLKLLGLQVAERRPFRPTRLYLFKENVWSELHSLSQFQPDVVIINAGSLFDVLNLPALRQFCAKLKAPILFFCHFVAEGFIPCSRDQIHEFLTTIQGWIFVSEQNKLLAERQLACYFKNAQVIPNTSRLLLNEPLSWPNDATIQLACVARLETVWKGQDLLMAILSKYRWRNRNWHLNLYGSGPDVDYLKQLMIHYSLEERVSINGYIRDIRAIWEKNHLMVLASRGEGMPLAVLEAMMCGRPTVTTDVGGNREILVEGETGWIAESATEHSFANALELAWSAKERWREIGIASHVSAQKRQSIDPPNELIKFIKKFC